MNIKGERRMKTLWYCPVSRRSYTLIEIKLMRSDEVSMRWEANRQLKIRKY